MPPAQKDSLENSAANTPIHTSAMSPVKAVNLLPDVPVNNNQRRLTDKEQKDCDVIGKISRPGQKLVLKITFHFRTLDQVLLLHRSEIDSGFSTKGCYALLS